MKKNINIILGVIAIIVLSIVAIMLNKPKKVQTNEFIESVKSLYASALKEYDGNEVIYSNVYEDDTNITGVKENLNYMVKFNEKGEIVYLVVSDGNDRFQAGSIYENTPIKETDITKDKIVKDITAVNDEHNNYVIIKEGNDAKYYKRGYYIEEKGYITIALGKQTSGTHRVKVVGVTGKEGVYTITVQDEYKPADVEIQVLSYPFVTMSLRGVKVIKLVIKDDKGYEFERLSVYKEETETSPVKEEEIRTIIIEKKDVTDEELKTYDQDSDGQITTDDIKVIKDQDKMTGKVTKCSKGEHLVNKQCVKCPVNTYGADGKNCTSCPVETCSAEGSKSKDDCKSCIVLTDPVEPPVEFE
jgi:hypothetical protein